MMGRIYPPELQLNKANVSDVEAQSLDLHLSISNGMWDVIVLILDHCLSIYFLSSKIYDKRNDFDFDIVNSPCLDGDVPPFYLVRCLHFSTYSIC